MEKALKEKKRKQLLDHLAFSGNDGECAQNGHVFHMEVGMISSGSLVRRWHQATYHTQRPHGKAPCRR